LGYPFRHYNRFPLLFMFVHEQTELLITVPVGIDAAQADVPAFKKTQHVGYSFII
jgi:hypothetical protein